MMGKALLSPFLYKLSWQNRLFLNMLSEKNTFKKEERLKSRKLIESLFAEGSVINQFPFRLIYKIGELNDSDSISKIAVSVSKRNFKRAVDRNYIKRKLRESFRKNKNLLYKTLLETNQNVCFIVIYIAKEDISYQDIEKEMKLLLNKFVKRLESNK
jgi:ribonuclease P protein component